MTRKLEAARKLMAARDLDVPAASAAPVVTGLLTSPVPATSTALPAKKVPSPSHAISLKPTKPPSPVQIISPTATLAASSLTSSLIPPKSPSPLQVVSPQNPPRSTLVRYDHKHFSYQNDGIS